MVVPLLLAGAFENTVVALYKYAVPKPKDQCSKVGVGLNRALACF